MSSGCRSSTDASPSRPASRPRTCSSSRTARRSSSTRTAARAAPPPVPAGYVYVDGLSVGDVGDIVLRDRRALANDGMFMIVVTVDKQTGSVVGRPEIITRGFVHLNEADPIMKEALERVDRVDPHAGRPHQRDRPAQDPDQGRRLAVPVRADEAPADGLPGRRRGLTWPPAAEPRPASRPRTRPSRARSKPLPGQHAAHAGRRPLDHRAGPARPGRDDAHRPAAAWRVDRRGDPDELVDGRLRPVVRDHALGRAVLLPARRLVARVGPRDAAGIGLGDHPARSRDHLRRARRGGPDPGHLGRPAGTCPRRHPDRPVHGAGGLRPAHRAGRRRHHRGLRDPAPAADEAGRGHRPLDGHDRGGVPASGRPPRRTRTPTAAAARVRQPPRRPRRTGARTSRSPSARGKSPGQTGAWDDDTAHSRPRCRAPHRTRRPSPRPAGLPARSRRLPCSPVRCAIRSTSPTAPTRRRPRTGSSTSCRRSTMLDDIAIPLHAGGDETAHLLVEDIIVKKLASFGIPVRIVGRNAGPGRDPVRGPAGGRHQAQPDRGPVGRPVDGARRPLAPDRGAHPGQERGRHRDPQQGLQRRRPAADPRGARLQGVRLDPDLRPRPRRGRQGPGGRPRQDAPPAHRRGDRLGQERHGQRAHHQPPVRGDPGRRADDPDGPQAGRARRLQRAAPPAGPGHHRARAGQGRAQVGGQRDGGALPAAGRRDRPQHPRRSTRPGSTPTTGCPTSSSSSTSWPT